MAASVDGRVYVAVADYMDKPMSDVRDNSSPLHGLHQASPSSVTTWVMISQRKLVFTALEDDEYPYPIDKTSCALLGPTALVSYKQVL
jgi:hypothetical protein